MTAKFVPSPDQVKTVRAMSAYGIPQDQICKVVGVSLPTLHKAFRHELDTAGTEATAKVAQSLFQQALNGNVAAAIFWMKARAGWSEKIRVESENRHYVVSDKPVEQTMAEWQKQHAPQTTTLQ